MPAPLARAAAQAVFREYLRQQALNQIARAHYEVIHNTDFVGGTRAIGAEAIRRSNKGQRLTQAEASKIARRYVRAGRRGR